MKKTIVFLASLIFLLASGMAQATVLDLTFTYLDRGAISYDTNTAANVVTTGKAFYDTLQSESLFTLTGMTGNLGVWGVVTFDPSDSDFAWAAAHGDQLLDIEVRLRDLMFDLYPTDGVKDFSDSWRIVGWQDGTNYLTTFNELGAQGYTELTSGVWMDVALGPDYAAYGGNNNGLAINQMAVSFILEGVTLENVPLSLEANLLAGPLGGGSQYVVESGIRANVVPEPSTMLLFGAGLLALAGATRRKLK